MHAPLTNNRPAVKEISGRLLARRLRKGDIDPAHRARLALDLQAGKVRICDLTSKQARQLAGTTVAELAAMRRAARMPSDTRIDRFIAKAGTDRVLQAIDRMTAPANGDMR
jgi:hypothetical protein